MSSNEKHATMVHLKQENVFFGVHYIILGAHFFSFHLAFCKKHKMDF